MGEPEDFSVPQTGHVLCRRITWCSASTARVGTRRVQGVRIDLGAYEFSEVCRNDFERVASSSVKDLRSRTDVTMLRSNRSV